MKTKLNVTYSFLMILSISMHSCMKEEMSFQTLRGNDRDSIQIKYTLERIEYHQDGLNSQILNTIVYGDIELHNQSFKDLIFNISDYTLIYDRLYLAPIYIDNIASIIIRDEFIRSGERKTYGVYWPFTDLKIETDSSKHFSIPEKFIR